jgi:hypothetical protein
MRTLTKFIDDNNRWIAIFGKPAVNFPLTQADVKDILRTLDSNLSPENLHCDGEISHTEAQRKYRFYATVARELEAYCAQNNLVYTAPMEL